MPIPAVLDFPGDDVLSGDASNSPAEVRRQEVMNGPVPPAHTSPDGFLLDVLREYNPLLGELGMEGSRDIASGVQGAFITLEEHLFGVFTEETAYTAMHGLLFSTFSPELWLGLR